MPLPSNARSANQAVLTADSPSVGATPVTVYMSAPFRGRLLGFAAILRGAITTADCTVTVANVTAGTTICTLILTQSGSAAGQLFKTPGLSVTVADADVISITPSGASGSNVGADFRLTFQSGGV